MHENHNQPQLDHDQASPFQELAERRSFLEKVKEETFYAGFFVDREELYGRAAALRKIVGGESGIDATQLVHTVEKPHVTTKFAPEVSDLHIDELGSAAKITVIGYGNDGINEGFLVKVAADDPVMQAVLDKVRNPHITLSYSEGGHPKDTVDLDFRPLKEEDRFELAGKYCLHLKNNKLIDSEAGLVPEEDSQDNA